MDSAGLIGSPNVGHGVVWLAVAVSATALVIAGIFLVIALAAIRKARPADVPKVLMALGHICRLHLWPTGHTLTSHMTRAEDERSEVAGEQ